MNDLYLAFSTNIFDSNNLGFYSDLSLAIEKCDTTKLKYDVDNGYSEDFMCYVNWYRDVGDGEYKFQQTVYQAPYSSIG